MKSSYCRRSIPVALVGLAACTGNVEGTEDVARVSSRLAVDTATLSLPTVPTVQRPVIDVPHIDCVSATLNEYPVANGNSQPQGITSAGGSLWFTGWLGVSRFSPSTPDNQQLTLTGAPDSGPSGITVGPDGNLWFTEMLRSRIGTISLSGTLLNEYPNPSNWASGADDPSAITSVPDGTLWFAGYAVGEITTSGQYTPPITPTSLTGSTGMTTDPNGNVWFVHMASAASPATGQVVEVVPSSGQMTAYTLPPATPGANSMPWSLTVGPDGNLWVIGNNVWKVSTNGEVLATYAIPGLPADDFYASGIATGSDGNLYFTEYATNQVGEITTSGSIAQQWKLAGTGPNSIALGPDGALWFTEQGGSIGRISPAYCTF